MVFTFLEATIFGYGSNLLDVLILPINIIVTISASILVTETIEEYELVI